LRTKFVHDGLECVAKEKLEFDSLRRAGQPRHAQNGQSHNGITGIRIVSSGPILKRLADGASAIDFRNRQELAGIEARAADKRAIDVFNAQQLFGVPRLD
jgi:hypothetical protein